MSKLSSRSEADSGCDFDSEMPSLSTFDPALVVTKCTQTRKMPRDEFLLHSNGPKLPYHLNSRGPLEIKRPSDPQLADSLPQIIQDFCQRFEDKVCVDTCNEDYKTRVKT